MLQAVKTPIINTFLVLVASTFFLGASFSHAQIANGSAHGKTAAIPTKTPDGTWDGLNLAQQKILAPLESDWDYMLPDSRKKWIYVANLYPKMSTQDQDRLQSRMISWSNLSQKDRRIARENYLASLKFPAEKKAEAWSAYQKLSDEQKKKLAEMEAKKKPNAINAPTLQQHNIKQETTPPPPAPRPRAVVPEAVPTNVPTSTESQ
ncbi:hypothetical protein A8O14_04655 [Polynucleobacter wuianus]|uniref:DUF3106 domain-containing protein n=1 Tax=Polynucleobacter wuianus TaxID=1743168 RepID=A0A191UEW3_9BURK|nr:MULTISPECIES: DUF3106 domain-containing protein [Polynucleobacter]ANI99445.1 hypothetical protein A8O14_04655 [Polynucleobacter wuianus]MBU3551942.1 DUF3106 domain-containing protein [Polynucleobacter sp. MWH-Post4-6-1]MBU3609364.1 DUF3106 domain-containing protein [Polynucleobacter wuianus]